MPIYIIIHSLKQTTNLLLFLVSSFALTLDSSICGCVLLGLAAWSPMVSIISLLLLNGRLLDIWKWKKQGGSQKVMQTSGTIIINNTHYNKSSLHSIVFPCETHQVFYITQQKLKRRCIMRRIFS
uniref:Uncharacterized protein n=1 Tax=Entomoneis paludosa TaxID=265537 RepID=A0A6U2XGB6_9STRA